MSSSIGEKIKISIFGESHGKSIGVVIDGLPPGEEIDIDELLAFMGRRAPGHSSLTTKRVESDHPKFISGLLGNVTTGFPVAAVIENKDQRSVDYRNLTDIPRPSHADYTAFLKYRGFADMRGSGHFSGRLTAPICVAGGIAKQILAKRDIFVGAHLAQVGEISDERFSLIPSKEELENPGKKEFPLIDKDKSAEISAALEDAINNTDSLGAVIECAAINFPKGLGNPMFNGVENKLAASIFGIPGVKGIEFGAGFRGTQSSGSKINDEFYYDGEDVCTSSNNSGGINGGITNGMPIVFSVAMKPTSSISKPQKSISLSEREDRELVIKGRHDPCIGIRAVPVVEAMCALTLLDLLAEEGKL